MKQRLVLLAVTLLLYLPASAQSTEADSVVLTDSFFQDSVFQEVIADGTFNFSILGKYARNEHYYQERVERFERADTTLLGSDFLVLYYGYAYRDEYDGGYSISPWGALMNKKQRYEEAYGMILNALKTNPASLYLIRDALRTGRAAGKSDQELFTLGWRLSALMYWISIWGDGTQQSPYLIISVGDEYAFMSEHLGVQKITNRELVMTNEKPCDKMHVVMMKGAPFSGSEVWFDISYPYVMLRSPQHWANIFKTEGYEKN